MRVEDLEAEVMRLAPTARARLATKLLASLEALSDEENLRLWVEEAERRDQAWDATGESGQLAEDVLREARSRLS